MEMRSPRETFIKINTKLKNMHTEFAIKGFKPIDVGLNPGDATGDTVDEALIKILDNVMNLIGAVADK
jgi:hypothetical protein